MSEKPDLSMIENTRRLEVNEKERNILEVGCGIIPFFIVPTEEEIVNLGKAHYIGLDIKKGRTTPAADYLEQKNLPTKFDFITGEGDKLPFRNKVFDEVFFNNVFGDAKLLFHKYGNESAFFKQETKLKKKAFINEAFRVLKKAGKLIIFETYTPEIAQDFFKNIDFDNDNRFSLLDDIKYQEEMKSLFIKKLKEREKVREKAFFIVYKKMYG